MNHRSQHHKGRGALSNPEGRFEQQQCEESMEHLESSRFEAEEAPKPATTLSAEPVKSIINRNDSPDVPFDLSINPYRGCEHGCIYCYARPSHAYLNLSPGLDFETKLFYKKNAAQALEQQLRHPAYRCRTIALGANTDPYQPVEKEKRVTRSLLEVMHRFKQPVSIITKSSLIERDIDLLSRMAQEGLVQVMVSITSLRDDIKRTLEPRAASAKARLKTIEQLSKAGIPTGTLVAPIIPALTDDELESILDAATAHGAQRAGYILLRLPYEVKDLFREWLHTHFPLRAEHVMSLIQQSRGGKDYDADFSQRMSGQGHFADLLAKRFILACKRNQLNGRHMALDTSRFKPPQQAGDQMALF